MDSPMDSSMDSFMDLQPFLDQAKTDLANFVALESVSAQGRMLSETASFLRGLLEAEGFKVRSVAGQVAPVLIAEIGQGPRTLLIYNHYDVQPETPLQEWNSAPFVLSERDGRWYGRGVSDDKGEIISRLAALRAFKAQHGGAVPLRIKWLIEGEEEIGSPSLEKIVATHAQDLRADACWWEFGSIDPQGRPVIYAGLKGCIGLELRARVAHSDLHSSYGAVVDNPLWRLSKAVASLRDGSGRVTIPGFYDAVRAPSKADLAAVARIPDESAALQHAYGITHFLEDGKRFYERLDLEPVVNINGFHGGYGEAGSKTVLPREGFVKLDIRLVPDQIPSQIIAGLRAHLDAQGLHDIEILELDASLAPARSDMTHPIMGIAQRAAKIAHGQDAVLHPSSGGSGPMGPFVEHLGVAVIAAGISNVQSFVHAPNENIVIEHFNKGVRFGLELFAGLAASQ